MKILDVLPVDTILDIPLFMGGPVQPNTLHFIHTDANLEDARGIGKGLYWGGNFDQVLEEIGNNTLDTKKYRFFLGYSGWGAGQLVAEMEIKSWLVTAADSAVVFLRDSEEMWRGILQGMGGSFKMLSNYPESPFLN